MPKKVVEASATAKAGRLVVWTVLADAASYSGWSAMDETVLEKRGKKVADGVGAIRRFRTGTVTSREKVVVFDAPAHLGYTLVSGMPLTAYRADVRLTQVGDATEIHWRAEFEPKVTGTGWFYARVLRSFLKQLTADLARAATAAEGADA